jgi:DNA-binding MarR family transcriptional regulator
MHFVAFAFKRAHRSSLALVRPWLRGSPITPARYDILHAILASGMGGLPQFEICRCLGLSPATISRAVKRLEELGIVIRRRYAADRRFKLVAVTALGFHEFRKVFEKIVAPLNALPAAYAHAISTAPLRRAARQLRSLHRCLRKMARAFGDVATLASYPTSTPRYWSPPFRLEHLLYSHPPPEAPRKSSLEAPVYPGGQ